MEIKEAIFSKVGQETTLLREVLVTISSMVMTTKMLLMKRCEKIF